MSELDSTMQRITELLEQLLARIETVERRQLDADKTLGEVIPAIAERVNTLQQVLDIAARDLREVDKILATHTRVLGRLTGVDPKPGRDLN